ncbi:MAG: NADH-quinone oxidoreductase subunit J [candidate division WOR-3 bacterium]
MVLHLMLLALLVVFLFLAVLLSDTLRAAIALALGSAVLSLIFFWFRAPFAAVFELSVCAGLVMVLLVSTIGLTRREVPEHEEQGKSPVLILPLLVLIALGVVDIIVFVAMSRRPPILPVTAGQVSFAETLWRGRWIDILGQLAIILAGVFAILALFRKEPLIGGSQPPAEREETHDC